MRFLPTRVHGVLDYLWAVLLAATPWALGSDLASPEARVAWVFAAGAFLYSLLTDYELGVFRTFSMRAHLALDIAGGLLLAASPWLFGFADRVRGPHLAFGLFSVFAGLVTETRPRRYAGGTT
jgi:hypothetical protein